MERCPNCGASTRPGAKFCTTCGFHLVDAGPAPDPTDDAAEPARVDAADAPTGWPAPPTEAAFAAAETATIEDVGSTADDTPDPAPDPTGGDETAATDVDDQVLDSSWPNTVPSAWSTGWEPALAPAAVDSDPPLSGPEAAADADPPPGWTTAAFGAPPDLETEPAAEPSVGAHPDPTDAPVDAAPEEAPPPAEATPPPAVDDAPPLATAAPTDPTDAATRAAVLVDELRALLPQLAAPAADRSTVTAALASALATDGDGAADRAALRAALLAARERPRDIDTVLDLSGRVDDVLALLDAHDRALAAIERALAALRSEATAES